MVYLHAKNAPTGPLPVIYPSISEALMDCDSPVYILVGDESHVPTAIASLSHLSVPMEAMNWNEIDDINTIDNDVDNDNDNEDDDDNEDATKRRRSGPGIIIVPPGEGGRGHGGILQHIVMSVKRGSSVHVIHSDISTLQQAKSLFGDNRPSRQGMFARSGIAAASLKLSLPAMSSGPQSQNYAEMDPWLNLIDEFELVEIISARIVTK